MTELVPVNQSTDVAAQMQWAQAVTTQPERGGQSILPEAYRNNPANVLIATGLGAAMGLSFAESLYRISVIKGKPSAAAELIAANVRKAGHKLRVQVSENPPSATCTIVRADDPDYPTTITRDMKWAQGMGLANEPNYKKQPATMLSYRAITACARLACPEALYGVTYTPDEAASISDGHEPEAPAPTIKSPGLDGLRAAVQQSGPVEPPEQTQTNDDVHDAEVVEEPETGEAITKAQRAKMFALFSEAGFTTDARTPEGRVARLDYIERIIGHRVESTNDLTVAQASQVIEALVVDAEAAEAQS